MGFTGGSNSISSASDVVFNNIVNNDAFIYDVASGKWKNSPVLSTKADDTTVVKLTGTQTINGAKTFSAAPTVPDGSFTVSKTSGLQANLDAKVSALEWGILPTLYINSSTGVWPSRTLPSGYSGAVVWDSSAYPDAANPTNAANGDRWGRRKPTA
jgi:hypothetical protein